MTLEILASAPGVLDDDWSEPGSLVRMARWVRARLWPEARRQAREDQAWLAALVGSAISARATLDRAGGAFVLLLRLDHVPRAAAVARWAREIGERANSPVPAA